MTSEMSYVNYNILGKYEIIGRVPNGTSIVAYTLMNRLSGKLEIFPKELVEQLALDKQIYNANAQLYNNIVNLRGINCKLSKLPKYNANGTLYEESLTKKKDISPIFRIVGRVQGANTTTKAYILEYRTRSGETTRSKLDRDKVLELARDGYIVNAKAQLNSGRLMLRGIDEDLAALKTFREY